MFRQGGPPRAANARELCFLDRFKMTRQTSLTIVVPVYNEQYLVEASLERLFLLADSPLLESIQVIVVDDGSSDRTPEALERFHSPRGAGENPSSNGSSSVTPSTKANPQPFVPP